jgi:hypothetical protein
MAPPLIFLFFVIVVAAIVAVVALVAIRTGLWVRETSHPDSAPAPDLDDAGSTAEGSRADTAYAEGRERVYGDEAATDERFSRPAADRSARGR